MAKQLAHKKTKLLLTQQEINEKKANIGEFSSNWQGRVYILNADKSRVAEHVGVEDEGEYAIKVR
ncbi:MAG: DNA-directed RNA polymerase subunit E'' [Candidatus Woesearchaeota archaeon]